MYIFMHKMHWCNAFFFSLCRFFPRFFQTHSLHTSTAENFCTKQKKPFCFVFYRLCAPLNGLLLYHSWKCWMGSKKKFWVEEIRASKELATSVSRAYVCADYINLCNLQCNYCSEDKKYVFKRKSVPFKKRHFLNMTDHRVLCAVLRLDASIFCDSAAATVRQEVVVSPGCSAESGFDTMFDDGWMQRRDLF